MALGASGRDRTDTCALRGCCAASAPPRRVLDPGDGPRTRGLLARSRLRARTCFSCSWSPLRGSNSGPRPYQGRALPLSQGGGVTGGTRTHTGGLLPPGSQPGAATSFATATAPPRGLEPRTSRSVAGPSIHLRYGGKSMSASARSARRGEVSVPAARFELATYGPSDRRLCRLGQAGLGGKVFARSALRAVAIGPQSPRRTARRRERPCCVLPAGSDRVSPGTPVTRH